MQSHIYKRISALRGSHAPKKQVPSKIGCGQVCVGSEFTSEQVEFFRAIDRAQQRFGKLNASDPRVLQIAKDLGYRKA